MPTFQKALGYVLATAAAAFSLSSMAQPIEIDTPDAHIIVVRPVDIWSGDASLQEQTLAAIRDREASYDVVLGGTRYRGSPVVFQGVSDNPVTLGVQAFLNDQGIKLVRRSPYLFHVLDATTLKPADFTHFAEAQRKYRQLFVLHEGDPNTLATRVRLHIIARNVLSVGSLLLPAHELGTAVGADVMMNSGLAEDIGNLAAPARAALIPASLPPLEPSGYQEIDVRRVEFASDAPGEIIIAYRTTKTPELERSALITAIASVAGVGTTPDDVAAARSADFEERVSIWDACVADGKCQKEASNDHE